MADSSKKLVFEGVDNLSTTADKVEKKVSSMFNTITKKALELNVATKDQVKFIEESIRVYEKQANQILASKKAVLELNRAHEIAASSGNQRVLVKQNFADQEAALRVERNEAKLVIDQLKARLANVRGGGVSPSSNLVGQFLPTVNEVRPNIPVAQTEISQNDPATLARVKGSIVAEMVGSSKNDVRSNAIQKIADRMFTSTSDLNDKQLDKFVKVIKNNIDHDVNVQDKEAALREKVDQELASRRFEAHQQTVAQKANETNVVSKEIKAGEKKDASLSESSGVAKLQGETNSLLRDLLETTKIQHVEQLDADEKNTEKLDDGISEGGGGESPEETMQKKVHAESIGGGHGEESGSRSVHELKENMIHGISGKIFRNALFANLVGSGIERTLDIGKEVATGLSRAEEGETFLAETVSQINPLGIPIGAVVGGGLERRNREQFAVETAASRLGGLTGHFDEGFTNNKLRDDKERFANVYSAESYGYGIAETTEAREQFARMRGHAVDQSSVVGALAAEKNFTLDRGSIAQLFKMQRVTDSKGPLDDIARAIVLNPALKKDSTELEEIMKLQMKVISENTSSIEKQNSGQTAGMISKFRSIDSEFFKNPERLAPIISTINQSLKNPNNQFAEAESLQSLSQLKPGASYFQLLEMRSKGIAQEGFLDQFLNTKQKEVGGGENLMLALTKSLNLEPAVARAIVEAREKDPKLFENWGGDEKQLNNKIGYEKANIKANATSKVTLREEEMVKAKDAFVMGAKEGMVEVGHQLGKSVGDEIRRMNLVIHTPFGDFNVSESAANATDKLFGVEHKMTKEEADKYVKSGKASKDVRENALMATNPLAGIGAMLIDKFLPSTEKASTNLDSLSTTTSNVNDSLSRLNDTIVKLNRDTIPLNGNNGIVNQ